MAASLVGGVGNMRRRVMGVFALAFCAGFACLLEGCISVPSRSEAASVRIYFQEQEVRNCAYLGEVVGSAGHWYNSWFFCNDILVNAALNDMRDKAHAKGADTLVIAGNTWYFQTSVTMLGQAYQCKK